MMIRGQRRLHEEEKQREQTGLGQHQQSPPLGVKHESSADAMRRLFMFKKNQPTSASSTTTFLSDAQHRAPSTDQTEAGSSWTFADCTGEINGCETSRVPGMQSRYQAVITPCIFCRRFQCQFCAVNCASCQEISCRSCSVASYEKPHVEHFCYGCRG
ncbi:hypothetical protein B0O80DRAFT_138391 [Mortierella sp. GBAus27b]|nr:hypothetical protein B0O80DRAFT_138391 [Mortierella sp. GBAus27b]